MSATFQCAECRGTFPKMWTDEEIDAEYARTHPDQWADGIPCGLLCESCYQTHDAPKESE